jgi:hypothetical protein
MGFQLLIHRQYLQLRYHAPARPTRCMGARIHAADYKTIERRLSASNPRNDDSTTVGRHDALRIARARVCVCGMLCKLQYPSLRARVEPWKITAWRHTSGSSYSLPACETYLSAIYNTETCDVDATAGACRRADECTRAFCIC